MLQKIFLPFFLLITTIFTNVQAEKTKYTMDDFRLFIPAQEIDAQIQKMAQTINEDYRGEELVIVMIMKGAVWVVADLMRYVDDPVVLEAISCKSYTGTTRGELTITGIGKVSLKDKHVLIVDDVYDSGKTMTGVANELRKQDPASIKTLVLLNKSIDRDVRKYPQPDYSIFTIPNLFVVGYGLDMYENYRGLKDIYVLKEF